MSDLVSALQAALGVGAPGETAKAQKDQEDRVRRRFKRISNAKDAKKKWEENYEVNRAHDYVRGFQRAREDEYDAQGERRYQINKILSALKAKIPTIFYYHPYIRIRPSRGREDTPEGTVTERAALLQDTINTIIRMPETRFKQECMMALKESNWAFGVVEIGYEAEWGENPYAPKPSPLVENEDVEKELGLEETEGPKPTLGPGDEDENEVIEELMGEPDLPHAEAFYVKHIPARQFFVSTNDRSTTETQDWMGYWEWMYVKDIKRTASFENTKDLKASGKLAASETEYDKELAPMAGEDKTDDIPADMIRVWKIWDQREKKRYVLAEGHKFFLKEETYETLPLFPIRLEVMPGEWYPVPPVHGQMIEQDEFNDSREWLRLVRKGTRPRYLYDKAAFTDEELDKLETDEFGTFIGVDNQNLNSIQAINQPSFSETTVRTLSLSEAGFTEQAASSPQARLTRSSGGAPTATEVQSLGEAGDVRSSYEQQEVADWLALVSKGLLKIAVERATLPTWVLMNSDPHSPMLAMDAMGILKTLQEIKTPIPEHVLGMATQIENAFEQKDREEVTPEDLEASFGDGRWDVTADIESLSPTTEAQHASRILQALNMLSSEGVGELLALSPELLKVMLNMMGIRNAADQKAIAIALQQKMMQNQMMQMMEQMMSGGGSAPAETGTAPMPGGPQPNQGAGGGPPPEAPGAPAQEG
jgi:hypothetical protein